MLSRLHKGNGWGGLSDVLSCHDKPWLAAVGICCLATVSSIFFLSGDESKEGETGEWVHEFMCHLSDSRVEKASPKKYNNKRSADYFLISKGLFTFPSPVTCSLRSVLVIMCYVWVMRGRLFTAPFTDSTNPRRPQGLARKHTPKVQFRFGCNMIHSNEIRHVVKDWPQQKTN